MSFGNSEGVPLTVQEMPIFFSGRRLDLAVVAALFALTLLAAVTTLRVSLLTLTAQFDPAGKPFFMTLDRS